MKALILSIAFFAISTFTTAQLAMNTSNTIDTSVAIEKPTTKKNITSKRTLKTIQRHNQSAAKQLSTYLNKQLQYSQTMQDYCMEGIVIIEINLSKTGTIVETKVIESPNAAVDNLVTEAMSNLKSIKFKNNDYLGSKRIRIPIDFTMR